MTCEIWQRMCASSSACKIVGACIYIFQSLPYTRAFFVAKCFHHKLKYGLDQDPDRVHILICDVMLSIAPADRAFGLLGTRTIVIR